jgi:hypothetical protein
MVTRNERLDGIRRKIDRAKTHINDVEVVSRKFCEANTDCLAAKTDPDSGKTCFSVRFRTALPEELPLMIGDVVHNLRTALDHLAWQLVEANGQTPGFHTSFPIFRVKNTKRFKRKVAGVAAAAVQIMELVQPYNSGKDDLAILSEMDNFDKHRLLIVVASTVKESFFGLAGMPMDQQHWFEAEVSPVILKHGALNDGDEVLRILPTGSEQYAHVTCSLRVALEEPSEVRGENVVTRLQELAKITTDTIDKFIPHL